MMTTPWMSVRFPFSSCSAVELILSQGMHSAHSARDLERGEGAALHRHVFEETIDWADPLREAVLTWCVGAIMLTFFFSLSSYGHP